MKTLRFDSGVRFDAPNQRWGDPSFALEPGDPGYVPPASPTQKQPRTKKRKYMASNPTPTRLDKLLAAGEDFCDGLTQHGTAIGVKQNTFVIVRADLDALIAAKNANAAAQGAQPAASAGLKTADDNGAGFISRSVKVLSISLGNEWSDEWLATGLPDNKVGVPTTQDGRFTALSGLDAYFTANPGKENEPLDVTAADAATLHTAISDARQGVAHATAHSTDTHDAREEADGVFRMRYRGGIGELEQLLGDDDPKWYDFGLNRPADSSLPDVPSNVVATAIGGGRVLVQIDGARRANSFSYYRKIAEVDEEPVKVTNTEGNQYTMEGLPAGKSVEVTVTGVNDAGEGPPSEPVSVVVT